VPDGPAHADVRPRGLPRTLSVELVARWRANRREVGLALLAAMVAAAGAAIVLRLWHADLDVPFRGTGDALFFQMLVKDAVESGWILTNPHLGAPFGQELYDYPVAGADALQLLVIKFLGLFTSSSAVVLNTYFLLTFPIAAIAAYAVLRWLRVAGLVAVAGAVLFALAPYHFLRSEYHFFLAATFPIPLGAYLVLAIYLRSPLFARREDGGSRLLRFVTPKTIGTLAICLAVGLSDFYYAAFTALLAGGATLVATALRRDLRTLLAGTAVTLAVVLATSLALAPSLVYRAQHGPNEALTRAPSESELYSLNIIGLVMPVESHRIDRLADIRNRYQRATSVAKESAPLGLLTAIGFVWLLAASVALCLGGGGRIASDPRYRSLAAANLTALLLGTTGGLSAVIAYAVGPELRTWSRMSIFIAFFAVAGLCILADAAWPWFQRRGARWRAVAAGGLALIVVIAVLDGTTPSMAPDYAAEAATYQSDEEFVDRIERTVGSGAQVFQLPYTNFPDSIEFAALKDYDGARGYLHSDNLRWSWGAMKGRPRDWQSETVNLPPELLVPMVSAAGFQGIYLDRFGYADNGIAVESQLRRILGVAPSFPSPNARLLFFDMRSYNAQLRAEHPRSQIAALATVTLRPLQTEWSTDSFNRESRDGLHLTRWTAHAQARIDVVNPSSSPRDVVLSMTLARSGGATAEVLLGYPGGERQRIQVKPAGTPVLRRLRVPPGTSAIEIDTAGASIPEGNSPGYVQVGGFQLMPSEALEVTGFNPFG
jgi:hypothetical protein